MRSQIFKPRILILGASGVTGRLVLRNLLRGDYEIAVAGRDVEKLSMIARANTGVQIQKVDLSDELSIARALERFLIVVNCVGPYGENGEKVVRAAMRTKTHYVDCSWEQGFINRIQNLHEKAKQSDVAVLTGFGLSPGLSDFLFHANCADFDHVSDVDIYYVQGSGNETLSVGTLVTTAQVMKQGGFHIQDGKLAPIDISFENKTWFFPQKFGKVPVVAYPGSGVITIANRASVRNIRHFLSLEAMTRILPRLKKLNLASALGVWLVKNLTRFANIAAPLNFVGKKGFSKMLRLQGMKSGSAMQIDVSVLGHKDPYEYTAKIISEAVDRLIHVHQGRYGVLSVGDFFKGVNLPEILGLKLVVGVSQTHAEEAL